MCLTNLGVPRGIVKVPNLLLRGFTKPRNGSTLRGPHLDNLTFNFKGATRRSAPFRFTSPCLKCDPLAGIAKTTTLPRLPKRDRFILVGFIWANGGLVQGGQLTLHQLGAYEPDPLAPSLSPCANLASDPLGDGGKRIFLGCDGASRSGSAKNYAYLLR